MGLSSWRGSCVWGYYCPRNKSAVSGVYMAFNWWGSLFSGVLVVYINGLQRGVPVSSRGRLLQATGEGLVC